MNETEYLFQNAMIFDGRGSQPFIGDVSVANGIIIAVGKLGDCSAEKRIDLDGLALCPGFIDVHTHDDRAVIDDPVMLPKISQGVTTVVTGNCGISLPPIEFTESTPTPPLNLLGTANKYEFPTMAAYKERLAKYKPAVNVVSLIGHSTLRLKVMEDVTQPANSDEIETMRNLLRQCMFEGASGFSTGLYYAPNKASNVDEVAAVASVASEHDGIYTTHMRNEGDHVLSSIEESASTSSNAKISLLISHLKCTGRRNWGRSCEMLDSIYNFAEQQTIHFDVYPYTAGSTILRVDESNVCTRIIITWSEKYPNLSGCDLNKIAKEWGVSREVAATRLQPAGAIYFQMNEDDVRNIISSRNSIIGSDGIPNDKHPHPRLWGTFPRVVGHYARDLGLMTMHEAIYKMTGLSAKVFGLHDRGQIEPGYAADMVVFNPMTIKDRATYEDPKQKSDGIEMVWVNGKLSFTNGEAVQTGAGALLKSRCP